MHYFVFNIFSYLQVQELDVDEIKEFLFEHRITGRQDNYAMPPSNFSIPFSPSSLQEELRFLGSIPNLHFDTNNQTHPSYQRNMCFLLSDQAPLPISKRNRVIYFSQLEDHSRLFHEIKCLLDRDLSESHYNTTFSSTRVQTRKFRSRVSQLTTQQILEDLGEQNAPDITNVVGQLGETNLFEHFTHQLLTVGDIYWRSHTPHLDTFSLNAYDIDTGSFIPMSFVHATIERSNEVVIKCTCDAYRMLLSLSDEDAIASSTDYVTCMHARLLQKYLVPEYNNIISDQPPLGEIQRKLHSSFINRGTTILNLTEKISPSTVKFSVQGTDSSFAFVHLSDNCQYIACQSGKCNILMGFSSRRKSRTLLNLDQSAKLCPHLETMLINASSWSSLVSQEEGDSYKQVACF